jgi:hypothetical protein
MMRALLAVFGIGTFAGPGRAETITFERETVGIPPGDCGLDGQPLLAVATDATFRRPGKIAL